MKKRLAASVFTLALALGLMIPGIALAADSGDLAAAKANPTAQPTLTAQDVGVRVVDGPAFYNIPQTITVIGRVGSAAVGYVENNCRFSLYKDGELVDGETVSYTGNEWDRGSWAEWEFTVYEAGSYEVCYRTLDSWAYDQTVYSATFTVAERMGAAVKNLKPTFKVDCTDKNKVELSWDTQGADGAKVYRATKKNGKYKLVRTAAGSECTNKVKMGKVYFYKIRLYSKSSSGAKTYLSKFSKVKAVRLTTPKVPVVTSAKSTSKGVVLKWKKSPYSVIKVYRGSKMNQQLIAKLKSGTVTYTDKDVKKGKTYYYSVSADRDFTYFGTPDNLLFAIDKNATKVKVTKKVKA